MACKAIVQLDQRLASYNRILVLLDVILLQSEDALHLGMDCDRRVVEIEVFGVDGANLSRKVSDDVLVQAGVVARLGDDVLGTIDYFGLRDLLPLHAVSMETASLVAFDDDLK